MYKKKNLDGSKRSDCHPAEPLEGYEHVSLDGVRKIYQNTVKSLRCTKQYGVDTYKETKRRSKKDNIRHNVTNRNKY